MRPERLLRLIAKWSAYAAGAVFLVLAASFVFIQTGPGKSLVSSALSSALSSPPQRKVVVGDLHRLIPFQVRCDEIIVRDAEGEWLSIKNVDFRWSPLVLLSGRIKIEEMIAATATMHRLPEEKPKVWRPPHLPQDIPMVTVDRVAVSRLELGKSLLGRSVVLQLEGRVLPSRSNAALAASVHLWRQDIERPTQAQVTMTLHRRPTALRIQAELREAAGGWLSTLLGLERSGPLRFTFEGDGPLSGWKGILHGDVNGVGSTRVDVTADVGNSVGLTVRGRSVVSASFLPERLRPLLGTETHFESAVHGIPYKSWSLEQLEVQGAEYRMQASGQADLASQALKGEMTLQVHDLNVLQPLTGSPLSGKAAVHATVSGTFPRPQGTIVLDMGQVLVHGIRIQQARTQLQVQAMGPLFPHFSGIQVAGTGWAEDLATSSGKTLPETSIRWSLHAGASGTGKLSITKLQVDGDQMHLALSGRGDRRSRDFTADTVLRVDDLTRLSTYFGKRVSGSAIVGARLSGNQRTASGTCSVSGILCGLGGFPDPLSHALSPKVSFSGDLRIRNGTHLTLPLFEVTSPVFRIKTSAALDFSRRALDANWSLSIPDLRALDRSLSGSIQGEGRIAGNFNALESTASLRGEAVSVGNFRAQKALANLQVTNIPEAPMGSFDMELHQDGRKLELRTMFADRGQKLAVHPLLLETAGTRLSGNIEIDLRSSLVQGNVKGNSTDLSTLGAFLGQTIEGSADLRAWFSSPKGRQNIVAVFKGKELAASPGKANECTVSATLEDMLGSPQGSATLEIKSFQGPAGLLVDSLNLSVSGNRNQGQFRGTVRGHRSKDFDLETRGTFRLARQTAKIGLDIFEGHISTYPLKLTRPASLERSPDAWSLHDLDLVFGPGRLTASGFIDTQKVMLLADFGEIPLEAATLFSGFEIQGSAGGRVSVHGDLSQPTATLALRLADVCLPGSALDSPPAIVAEASLTGDRLTASFDVQGLPEHPVRGDLDLPVHFSLIPLRLSPPAKGAIQGHIRLQADLAYVQRLIPFEDHLFAGDLTTRIDIQGTVAAPEIAGDVAVQEGTYQNLSTGTLLKNVELRILARGRRLELIQGRATDGENGTISATGWVDLDEGRDFPVQLDLTLSDAALIHRDYVTAALSGALQLSGSLRDPALTGKLGVDSAEIDLPKRPPSSIPELEVIEINLPVGRVAQERAARRQPLRLKLDIGIDIPGHVFIRGHSIDSEWKGELHVTGPVSEPVVTGVLTPVRGTLDFLNRRFTVVHGTIRFYGATPPAPVLDILTEAKAKDITAQLSLSGPLSTPKIELQSTPPLPPDEILARLLFGRTLARITPFQAVRLANAVRTMSGGGDTLGVLDRTRKLLGVQELELKESEEGPAVGVGKYVTEDVYVGVEKGVTNQTGKVSVEVELTPNVTLETEAGVDAARGIGLNWKHDY